MIALGIIHASSLDIRLFQSHQNPIPEIANKTRALPVLPNIQLPMAKFNP
jgi:hypothetical protein